jgi:hypothetical protein
MCDLTNRKLKVIFISSLKFQNNTLKYGMTILSLKEFPINP